MGIKINSAEVKTGREFVNYTGVAKVKVVAINPTLAELEAIGITYLTSEPEYTSISDEGHSRTRIDVYVQHLDKSELITRGSIFLEDKEAIGSTSGKYLIINDLGQSTWNTDVQAAIEVTVQSGKNAGKTWFKPEGARIAKVGEVTLFNFIRDWVNAESTETVKLDTSTSNLAKGNVNELKKLVKDCEVAKAAFKAFFVVNDTGEKQYQQIDLNVTDKAWKICLIMLSLLSLLQISKHKDILIRMHILMNLRSMYTSL